MEIYATLKKCIKTRRYPGDPYYLSLDSDFNEDLYAFLFDLFIRTGTLDYTLKARSLKDRRKEAIEQVKSIVANEKYTVLKSIIEQLVTHDNNSDHKLSVIIEDNYAELVYRDSYYMYYAAKHYSHSRMCSRLFFFLGRIDGTTSNKACVKAMHDAFLGFMTLKPSINGIISRTILDPKYLVNNVGNTVHCIRTCSYDCTMYGARLEVKGFPYMMQDTETTTCAEVTILNLADYFSKKYAEYRLVMPSEIDRLVGKYIPEGTLPTHGMSYANLTHVLKEIGFQPRLYAAPSIDLKRIVNYYVDSAIPVALGLFRVNAHKGDLGHSVICVGKRVKECVYSEHVQQLLFRDDSKKLWEVYVYDEADASNEYFIMDDNKPPYSEMTVEEQTTITHMTKKVEMLAKGFSGGKDWLISSVAVPLGKGMYLDAMGANDIVKHILSSSIGLNYAYANSPDEMKEHWNKQLKMTEEDGSTFICGMDRKHPLVYRLFLTTSRSFKRHRVGTLSPSTALVYGELPMPQYVWVCELYTPLSYSQKQVIGEIVLDATASQYEQFQSVVLIHYPHTLYYRLPQNKYSEGYWRDCMRSPRFVEDWTHFPRFEFGNDGSC